MGQNITYREQDGYQIPNLTYGTGDTAEPYGRYASLHRRWLKQEHPAVYNGMLLRGGLVSHLEQVEHVVREQVEQRVQMLLAQERDMPDQQTQPMEWMARMDSLRQSAEEKLFPQILFQL